MKALAATNLSFIYFLEGATALLYSMLYAYYLFSLSLSLSLLAYKYVSYVSCVCHKQVFISARTVTLRSNVTLHCYRDIILTFHAK